MCPPVWGRAPAGCSPGRIGGPHTGADRGSGRRGAEEAAELSSRCTVVVGGGGGGGKRRKEEEMNTYSACEMTECKGAGEEGTFIVISVSLVDEPSGFTDLSRTCSSELEE